MKTPADIPMIVVIAKPFNNPAPAHIKGMSETKEVMYAPRIIANARFSLSLSVSNPFIVDSSIRMIKSSKPVPIVAIIPAMLGKSRFHSIREAIPKIIIISEKLIKSKAMEDFIFLYFANIIIATAINATRPAKRIDLMKSLPRVGEIVSNFTISNL